MHKFMSAQFSTVQSLHMIVLVLEYCSMFLACTLQTIKFLYGSLMDYIIGYRRP